ncbi:beta-ketoacyl synthase N-terminal-like domain-containing protein [Winslowiella iniecta]|nr:beta-ketoacyl synthase N-terminal-like domain-containing protein [Winslowiella iniecta]
MTAQVTDRVAISGQGFYNHYAENPQALIAQLEQGKVIASEPFFARDSDAETLSLPVNPRYVPLPHSSKSPHTPNGEKVLLLLEKVVGQALNDAGMAEILLQGERSRCYIAGNAMRANIADFIHYKQHNDPQDLQFFRQIKALHSDSFRQDRLINRLAARYALRWPPVQIYTASSSGLSALHLAQQNIAAGIIDIALVVGWMDQTLQDLMLLSAKNMLSDGDNQPFSAQSQGVLPVSGVVAFVLESEQHARQRDRHPWVGISASASGQRRGGHAFAADFRVMASTFNRALQQARLTTTQIAAVLPHGNGICSSDNAEAMAIANIWGPEAVPVVSYKSQMGYLSSCSGLADVIIATDALRQRRLLAFTAHLPLDNRSKLSLHSNATPLSLKQRHIVKSSFGLGGAALACVISAFSAEESGGFHGVR